MSSPFLDKFSPEIRAIIYVYVFGPGEAITPTAWLKQMYCDDSDEEFYCNPSALQFRDEEIQPVASVMGFCLVVM